MQSGKPPSQADAIRPRARASSHPPSKPAPPRPGGMRAGRKRPFGGVWSGQALSEGTARERPGSYSWPALRREAEQRSAAGPRPAARHPGTPGPSHGLSRDAPSPRTMRRWYTRTVASARDPHPRQTQTRTTPGARQVRTHTRVDATPPMGRHRPALARRLNPTEQRAADGSNRTTARASRHRRVSRPCRSDRRRPSPRASLHDRVRSGSRPPCGPRRSARPARHYTWR